MTYIFGVLDRLIMHAAALAFVGILLLSMSGLLCHERIAEEFIIYDTGLDTTNPHSKAITSTSQKELMNEEQTLHKKPMTKSNFFLTSSLYRRRSQH
jgi:hypothetical protein